MHNIDQNNNFIFDPNAHYKNIGQIFEKISKIEKTELKFRTAVTPSSAFAKLFDDYFKLSYSIEHKGDDILKMYNEKVKSILVDIDGNEVTSELDPVKMDFGKNHKVAKEDRQYPVFMFMDDSGNVDAYILPMFGAGLWDWISGFIALDKDLNTVRGITFDHKQETPGLGARITDQQVTDRFKGTKIYEGAELVSVVMVKGEGNEGLTEHEVDGLSGATMTAIGVNNMLEHYLSCYQAYLEKNKKAL